MLSSVELRRVRGSLLQQRSASRHVLGHTGSWHRRSSLPPVQIRFVHPSGIAPCGCANLVHGCGALELGRIVRQTGREFTVLSNKWINSSQNIDGRMRQSLHPWNRRSWWMSSSLVHHRCGKCIQGSTSRAGSTGTNSRCHIGQMLGTRRCKSEPLIVAERGQRLSMKQRM